MRYKRKKGDYPDDWDVVEETQDPDQLPPPFETVAETQDPDASFPPFETVAKTQDPDGEEEMKEPDSDEVMKEEVPKAVRTKSAGTFRDKQYEKDKERWTVVCRLNRICTDKRLVEEIKRTAQAMKQIQMETWHLVNLHTLRCLKEGLPLPDYGKTFFDHCCSGVSFTAKSSLIATMNPTLWDSIQIYRTGRIQARMEEIANMNGFPELKNALREQLVVNAGVMIREHFWKRLRAYVSILYGRLGDDLTKEEEKANKKLVGDIMYSCYNMEESDCLEALQMRDLLTLEGVVNR